MSPKFDPAVRDAEQADLKRRFEEITGWQLAKLPSKYQVSYAAMDDHGIKALVDLQRRNFPRAKFPDYEVPLHRMNTVIALACQLTVPYMIGVQWQDSGNHIHTFTYEPEMEWNAGITLRQRGSEDEWDIYMRLPVNQFFRSGVLADRPRIVQ